MKSETYNMDCMDYMRTLPDKAFELAIVDPPYGIGISASCGKCLRSANTNQYKKFQWDNSKPNKEYFDELSRVSKNQIIFGGNYFSDYLMPTSCWIVWNKMLHGNVPFADCELAWASFGTSAKVFNFSYMDISEGSTRIHPTQKPVALYKWLLSHYAHAGDRILDTHLGSGSSRIAAYDMGFDFVGIEIDKDYFEAEEKRYSDHVSQLDLIKPEEIQQLQFAVNK